MSSTANTNKYMSLTPKEIDDFCVMCEQLEARDKELTENKELVVSLRKVSDELRDNNADFLHKNAVLEQQIEVLRGQVGTGGHIAVSAPIVEDGQAGSIPPLDPRFAPPGWASELLDPLMEDETQPIVALTGAAGIGKTHGIEQWAARKRRRTMLINCKGQDPYAFVESQELRDGQTTRSQGILTQAIQSPNTIVILDEIDTAPAEFQSLLLSMLEVEPHRRRITTQGNGVINVAPGIRFVLTLNNIGMNCGSRHRGQLLPPLQNRISGCSGWIAVPMPDENDLCKIFLTQHASMDSDVLRKVARATLALIKLSSDGSIDCDVSIRTGLGVCRAIKRFGVHGAWKLALLNGIDDPTQKAAAITAISAHFPKDGFRPVGK